MRIRQLRIVTSIVSSNIFSGFDPEIGSIQYLYDFSQRNDYFSLTSTQKNVTSNSKPNQSINQSISHSDVNSEIHTKHLLYQKNIVLK